jgi:hypothetical protein
MRYNHTTNTKPPVNCRTTRPAEPYPPRGRAGLALLSAVMAMILLSGCVSASVRGDSDPWRYNPNTGYPLIGGPFPHL